MKYSRKGILKIEKKTSFSHPGVAAASRGPWLPGATVISPRWIGAGEDGRVFGSGKSSTSFAH